MASSAQFVTRRGVRLVAAMVAVILLVVTAVKAAPPDVRADPESSPRVAYGVWRLAEAIRAAGLDSGRTIIVGTAGGPGIHHLVASGQLKLEKTPGHEGFVLSTCPDGTIAVAGGDDSGVLYGCLELASRIKQSRRLPEQLQFADAPVMKLRGPCIGMQKTYILPGRHVYEYPYTPELFPFFYDKAFWTEYLDFLADNRFNTLYLWNGHPFSSLVKLPDYPEALEVPEDVFRRNVEMYRYIAREADRRGIWVVQMFYNILLPKPLAEEHGLETQLAAPTPLAADYTRKCLAEFVKQYPNVGLMVCLGEALQGQANQTQWLTQVILPGIKDGMREAGLKEEPPVVIRTHATDLRQAMPEALKVYHNLYTEAKYTGESLTTWEPRGKWQQIHLDMSRLGSTHLINIHILANLEPFRYGAQRFIQKCVQAGRDRLGAKGIHLYPLCYWNWPDSADAVTPPLQQIRRDWIWFEAWGRYAWGPDIDQSTDRAYWVGRLAGMYGANESAAGDILDAYNDSGECAPRLIRRFGITEGNRQTLSLGMTLDELVRADRYRALPDLWESDAPPGERLQEYVDREWEHQKHEGETPPQIIREVLDYSARAVAEVDRATSGVTRNNDEFARLRNDIHCIRAMSQNYATKANAAMCVLRYQHSHDIADMEQAEKYLAESLEHYRELERLTRDTYRFANSMQTRQRKIPVPGGEGGKPAFYHWSQLLPVYEKELRDFHAKVEELKHGNVAEAVVRPLPSAAVKLLSPGVEQYRVQPGAKVFTDGAAAIQAVAPELTGLTGIRFSNARAAAGKDEPVEFEADQPVQVLIGYIRSDDAAWRKPPQLETDALAAEHGGSEAILQNAATISSLPPVDVHVLRYDAGRHRLEPRGSGSFIVLGVVPQSAVIAARDAHLPGGAR